MYIMYVDESGDAGLSKLSPTRYFVLSGIVVHERDWRRFIEAMIKFKKTARMVYGLPMRAEIHSSELINKNKHNIARHSRLAIIRNLIDELARLDFISVTNVVIDKNCKSEGYDVFEMAWITLFQRFENTMSYGNLPGSHKADNGIVVTDATSGMKLLRLVRRMAVYNPIPHDQGYGLGSRNIPITRIIEDPHGKDSRQALPIQACDAVAYTLYQKHAPNSYIKRNYAQNYFDRLEPVLNKKASRTNSLGIVYL